MFFINCFLAEVMKVLRAKKYAKMKRNLPESVDMLETHNSCCEAEARSSGLERSVQVVFDKFWNLLYS